MESTVNKRIVAMLKTLNLDELEVAKRIGKHPSTLYRIVNGENVPSRTTVKLIADAIGVNYDYLMTGKGESLMQKNAKTEVIYENPYKDALVSELKSQVEYLKEMLKMALSGKNPNFLKGIGEAPFAKYLPGKRTNTVRAAA